jgi:phenol 2-monooxygenase (NADPH)
MTPTLASEVDVLIIGAGPAGLMLALWCARLGVKARIVDKRTAKVFSGQADGYAPGLPIVS